MTVTNENTVASAISEVEAEIKALEAPVTEEEVYASAEEDEFLVRGQLARWVEVGPFERPKKGDFGFVHGVFVPPSLAKGWDEGCMVSVHFYSGKRGPVADGIAKVREFISWHQELVDAIKSKLEDRKSEKLKWFGKRAQSIRDDWELKKTRAKEAGFTLREIRDDVKSSRYGGRGETTYLVDEEIDEAGANRLLDAIHGRHAEKDPAGPYDAGHDTIKIIEGGFVNEWAGPWTD